MAAKRQTVIGLTAGAIIAVAIGILGILHATAFDPETVKTELQSRIDQLNRIPENDPISREALAKELLANDSYKQHAKALYLKVERAYPRIHEAANLERAARKEVAPFLAKCKDLARVSTGELDALYGEVRALLRNYGTTRHGDELRRLEQQLEARCKSVDRCTANDVVALSREVQKQVQDGHYAPGYKQVSDFERKYVNAIDFEGQLREIRMGVRRKAEPEVAKILAEGRTSEESRKKALQRLEGSDFKGLPMPALDAAVRTLKPR